MPYPHPEILALLTPAQANQPRWKPQGYNFNSVSTLAAPSPELHLLGAQYLEQHTKKEAQEIENEKDQIELRVSSAKAKARAPIDATYRPRLQALTDPRDEAITRAAKRGSTGDPAYEYMIRKSPRWNTGSRWDASIPDVPIAIATIRRETAGQIREVQSAWDDEVERVCGGISETDEERGRVNGMEKRLETLKSSLLLKEFGVKYLSLLLLSPDKQLPPLPPTPGLPVSPTLPLPQPSTTNPTPTSSALTPSSSSTSTTPSLATSTSTGSAVSTAPSSVAAPTTTPSTSGYIPSLLASSSSGTTGSEGNSLAAAGSGSGGGLTGVAAASVAVDGPGAQVGANQSTFSSATGSTGLTTSATDPTPSHPPPNPNPTSSPPSTAATQPISHPPMPTLSTQSVKPAATGIPAVPAGVGQSGAAGAGEGGRRGEVVDAELEEDHERGVVEEIVCTEVDEVEEILDGERE